MSVSIYRAPERGIVRDGLRLYLDPMDPSCVRIGDINLRDISQATIRLPPAAMTSNVNNMTTTDVNGTYVVSASSDNGTGAWNAFNNIIEDASWHSVQPTYASTGLYSSTASTTANSVAYAGEWLQIQFPVSGVLKSYRIGPRQQVLTWQAYLYRSPRKWWIMGSNDGSTWVILDARSGVNDWTAASKTFTIPNNTTKYSYYRIVVNEIGNFANDAAQDSVQISELYYNLTEVYTGQLAGGASWNEKGWFELNGSPHMIVTNMIPYINTVRLYSWECWFWDDNPGLTASTSTLLMGHYGDVGILNVTGMYISSTGKMSNLTERNSAGSEVTQPVNSNTITITDGKWHHVCGVATSTVLLTYLDGQLVGVSSTRPGGLVSSTVPFRLGNALLRYHTCRMGPIRYYVDKALTAAEVRRNYFTDLARIQASDTTPQVLRNSNLVLYYDPANIDSYPGSGNTLYDLSGYGNNATLPAGVAINNGIIEVGTVGGTIASTTSNDCGNQKLCTFELWARCLVPSASGWINYGIQMDTSVRRSGIQIAPNTSPVGVEYNSNNQDYRVAKNQFVALSQSPYNLTITTANISPPSGVNDTIYQFSKTDSNLAEGVVHTNSIYAPAGSTLTISAYVKTAQGSASIELFLFDQLAYVTGSWSSTGFIASSTWTRYSHTRTMTTGTQPNARIDFNYPLTGGSNVVYVTGIQLEYGSTASAFQPYYNPLLNMDTKWHHIAHVLKSSTQELYIDGQLQSVGYRYNEAMTASPVKLIAASSTYVQFGPLRTYTNYALSSSEIQNNYLAELPKMNAINRLPSYNTDIFVDVKTPTSYFTSTTGVTFNTTMNYITFTNASQASQLAFPTKTYNPLTTGITILIKITNPDSATGKTFFRAQKAQFDGTDTISVQTYYYDAKKVHFKGVTSNYNMTSGETLIIGARFDPNTSSGTTSIWINGVQDISATSQSANFTNASRGYITMNTDLNGYNQNNWTLHRFAIYERVLSDADMLRMTQMMGEGPNTGGLVLHLDPRDPKCYPGTGTVLYDLSGNKNHCTLVGGATIVDNNYVLFNGNNSYITSYFNPELGNSRVHTYEAWFWDDSPPYNSFIRVIGDGSSSRRESLNIETSTGRVLTAEVDANTSVTAIGPNVCDGKWHYLVGVYTSSNLLIYVDGVLMATTSRTITTASSKNSIFFGFPSNTAEYGTYRMGATRVWLDTELTASQIKATYYRERIYYDTEKRGLVLSLDPRDPSCYSGTTTLLDLSGKGNNATLQSGATVVGQTRMYPPLPFTQNSSVANGTPAFYESAILTVSSAAYGNGTYTATSVGVNSYNYHLYGAWAAFDQNYLTGYESFNWYTSGTGALWASDFAGLWLQLPVGIYLQFYTLTQPQEATNNPVDWKIEASTNGTTWTQIHSVTGASWSVTGTQTFSIANAPSTAYTYYRILVQKTAGGENVRIVDWKLYGYESPDQFFINGGTQYIATSLAPNYDNNRLYSLELWFWDDAPGITLSNNTGLITALAGFSAQYNILHIGSSGNIYFAEVGSGGGKSVGDSSNFCDSRWHHIVAVSDSTTMYLYIDGVLRGSNTRPGGLISSGQPISIGGNHYGRYQTCSIGPVRIYLDRALSYAEILRNYYQDYYRYSTYNHVLNQISLASKTACRGAYSLYAMSSTYAGPVVQLRRSTDNSVQDFYSNIHGNLRTSPNLSSSSTLASWLGVGTGFIVTWYDQSGNGNHATQATSANQPEINATSLFIDFKTTSDRFLTMPSGTIPTGTLNAPYTLVVKHATVTGTTTGVFISSGGTTLNTANALKYNGSSYANYWWSNDLVFGTSAANSVVAVTYNGTNRQGFVNGTAGTITASSGYTVSAGTQYIGRDINGGAYLNGQINYIAIFGTSLLDYDIKRFK